MAIDDVLPLRPLTVAELLDAAVALLRRNTMPLLTASLVLAGLEQLALWPIRTLALADPPLYIPQPDSGLAAYWLLISVGLGIETFIIAMLGGWAGRIVTASLLVGDPGPRRVRLVAGPRHAWTPARPGAVIAIAVVVGALGTLSAAAAFFPWIIVYGLLGLAAPAVVIDGRGPLRALARSVQMVGRGRLRPMLIRLLGFFAWLLIRLALCIGGVYALHVVVPTTGPITTTVVSIVVWLLVNTVAYAVLACLDAVIHLENRMRVEGLDIALTRARARGEQIEPVLAAPR